MTDERKPRSVAAINATPAQMIDRSIGRIPRLRAAIEKANARGNTAKAAEAQAELDRRLAEIAEFKARLAEI
ncbi:MAG: hypothetical protein KA154_06975 [Gemmatimonadaceae bacterium]|nr:hypothetical protein [Gemmatimonadaceae bacterium]